MIGRAKWFLQMHGAVPADFEQSVGKLGRTFLLHPFKAFADRFGDGFGQALSGKPGELLGELVGVFVFDVEAHFGTRLPYTSTILPHTERISPKTLMIAKEVFSKP